MRQPCAPAISTLLVGALLLGGCGAPASWSEVAGPASWRSITALVADGDSLLVAAADPGPVLDRLTGEGRPIVVPVAPAGGYGALARLGWLAASRSGLVALGGVRGGAHGNVRWSVWRGGRDAAGQASGLTEQEQPFETFGGGDAGTLVGVATLADAPVVVGSWRGATALDIAVWTPDGARWVRRATPPGLANDSQTLRTASAVAATSGSLVLAGNETDLAAGAVQTAVAWTAPAASGPWSRRVLPGGPGRAVALACGTDACLVAGAAADGTARAWRLDGTGASEVPLPLVTLPASVVPVVAMGADRGWIALPDDGGTRVLSVGRDGVRTLPAAVGVPLALASAGGWLYLATRDAAGVSHLWTTPAQE